MEKKEPAKKKVAIKAAKKPARKPVRKTSKKPAAKAAKPSIKEKEVGFVEHYFGNISVAAIKLTKGPLKIGDQIHIKGHTSNFFQPVESIQIEHESVPKAAKGADIGVKVKEHARINDKVYLVKV